MKTKRVQWSESYRCGCVSDKVDRKKDLVGYCGQHGEDRNGVFKHLPNEDEGEIAFQIDLEKRIQRATK